MVDGRKSEMTVLLCFALPPFLSFFSFLPLQELVAILPHVYEPATKLSLSINLPSDLPSLYRLVKICNTPLLAPS